MSLAAARAYDLPPCRELASHHHRDTSAGPAEGQKKGKVQAAKEPILLKTLRTITSSTASRPAS